MQHLLLILLFVFLLLLLILLLLPIRLLLLILRLLRGLLLKLLFELLPLLHQLLILLHQLLILRLFTRSGASRRWRRWRWQCRQLILRHPISRYRLLSARAIGRRGAAIHPGAATQQSEEGDSQNAPAQLAETSRGLCNGWHRAACCRGCTIFIARSLNQYHVTQGQHPTLSLLNRSSIRRPDMASAARRVDNGFAYANQARALSY